MTETHLKIKDLWHHYPSTSNSSWTLKSIDLNLNHGELVGLLGPSGCGKTTLLRLIAGFETPSKGFISIANEIVARPNQILPPENRGIGMVFQDCALFPHLDAWRNVCFGLRPGQDKGRANWLLEFLGLSELRNRYPHELSGGQKQRLALARALAPGNSLLVLDEPFSSLDVDVRNLLRAELKSLLESCSASAIFVTHDPQEALAICDRVSVMQHGELHQCSTPNELVDNPATPFVGRFVLQRNVLPIELQSNDLITPIGTLNNPLNEPIKSAKELLFDEHAIHINRNRKGSAIVMGREFLGTHWLLRVICEGHMLRVWQPLENDFQTGDRCTVSFKNGQKGILFPGAITCLLA